MLLGRIKLLICASVFTFWAWNVNAGEHPLVKIIDREIIEWHTISRTTPQCDMPGCLVVHYASTNQTGTKYMAKFAQMKWKGKIKEIELERTQVKTDEILQRSVSENPYIIFNKQD